MLHKGQRSLLAMNIHCIKDPNEITSHMLEVVQAHMQLFGKVQELVEGHHYVHIQYTEQNSDCEMQNLLHWHPEFDMLMYYIFATFCITLCI